MKYLWLFSLSNVLLCGEKLQLETVNNSNLKDKVFSNNKKANNKDRLVGEIEWVCGKVFDF